MSHAQRILTVPAAARPRYIATDVLLHAMYWDRVAGVPGTAANVLRVAVNTLRRELGGEHTIACVWGAGYRLADGVDVSALLPGDSLGAVLREYLAAAEMTETLP